MLKVGFIGLGAISHENVLGYLDSDDAQVVAVCDLNPAAGRKWLEKWSSHAHLYTDFHEMLSREDLDLVEIPDTPPSPLPAGGGLRPGRGEGNQPAKAHGSHSGRV